MANAWESAPVVKGWQSAPVVQQSAAQVPSLEPQVVTPEDNIPSLDEQQVYPDTWQNRVLAAAYHSAQPFIDNPLQAAYDMVVPHQEFNSLLHGEIPEEFKPENLARTTPIGSQQYYDEVVGNAIPLAMLGAGRLFGLKTAAERPETAPERLPSASEAPESIKTPVGEQNAPVAPKAWESAPVVGTQEMARVAPQEIGTVLDESGNAYRVDPETGATYPITQDELAQAEEPATFAPQNEPRPLDEAVSTQEQAVPVNAQMGEPAGQFVNPEEQSAGVGARGQSQAGPTSGVGVSHESLENAGLNPERGEGRTYQEAVDNGRQLLNDGANPFLAARRLKGETSRDPVDDADTIRAYREMLAQNVDAARATGDPAAYQAAQVAEQQFVKDAVKPLGTMWHRIGMGLQGETTVNPGDFNSLARVARDAKGAPLEPQEEAPLRKATNTYNRVNQDVGQAAEAYRQSARRASGGRTMSLDQLTGEMADFLKKATADCVV